MKRIEQLLHVSLPIIQAPMAGVQDSRLALVVAEAGGLGSLPCGMLSPAALEAEMELIKASSEKPINVNFFCHQAATADPDEEARWRELLHPYFEELGLDSAQIAAGASRRPFSHVEADILEPFAPPIVSFHFGLPAPSLLARVKGWGATVLASATTVAEAEWLEANGADIIIAQGAEAGGHRGMFLSQDVSKQVGTFALLPQIVRRVGLPVVAAGGIADQSGVAAVLRLGAVAAQVGTAYLLCPEANTRSLHRAALKSERTQQTVMTNLFSGRPARGIVNRLIEELGALRTEAPTYPYAATAVSALRKAAEQKGLDHFSPLWCGQNASGCQEISAHQLTLGLVANL